MVNPGEISANEKYKEQETFENTTNLIVGQNFNFRVETLDHGTWRRLRHYSSKISFRKNPNPENKFEKKEDQRFILDYVKDPDCLSALMGILAYYYERLQREYGGLLKNVRSQTLEYETERFRNSQDVINRFIMEMIVNSPGNGHVYSVSEIAGQFTEWFGTTIGPNAPNACETMQEILNSALRGFLKRAPNATHILLNCRILTRRTMILAKGESYMAASAVRCASPSACKKRQKWWKRVQESPNKIEQPAAMYDVAFSKVQTPHVIIDNVISNAELAALMNFADSERTAVSIADVFV